jgi:hypothetical protein
MGIWLFLSFAVVSVFSFVSVAVWAGTRQEERKQFYRGELLKKLAESGGTAAVSEYLREEQRLDEVRFAAARETMRSQNRLGGLILIAVGIACGIALQQLVRGPLYLFALAPAGVGIVLLLTARPRRR